MREWRRWSYAASLAVVITAAAFAFYRQGGELLAWPGLFVQVMANGLLLLLVPAGDDYDVVLPRATVLVFNVVIYSCIFYTLLTLIQKARAGKA